MTRNFHMCLDIKGAIKNKLGKKSLKGLFVHDNGVKCTHDEAMNYLLECIEKGWRVIPIGDCDNFDYEKGCQGHPVKEQEVV